jgi:glycerate kinase
MLVKIVIASDSFKGSCSTLEVANHIERGIKKIFNGANIVKIPVADGGEGTVDALVLGTNGKYEEVEVVGPLGEIVRAKYGVIYDDIAVIEMAAASGITLVHRDKLNPLITTTYGTGQLINSAMEKGLKKIYIGLGGSSTNDGGVGMAQALGVSFKDESGNEIGYGGGELSKIRKIDISNINPALKDIDIVIMTDVENPLCGLTGASYIFGPQKGASDEDVKLLDDNLRYYGNLIGSFLGKNIIDTPGTGAAGGLAVSLLAFGNASIERGIEKILELVNIERHIQNADLIITGEGKIDKQSVYGKVPIGVAKIADRYNLPVVAIVGSVGEGASKVHSYGIDLIMDIVNGPMTLDNAIKNAPELIETAAENLARILKMIDKIKKSS